MTSLQMLDLYGNQLKGNISSLIDGLTSLRHIDLSYNLLEGISFDSFANHSKFEFIQLICYYKKTEIETIKIKLGTFISVAVPCDI